MYNPRYQIEMDDDIMHKMENPANNQGKGLIWTPSRYPPKEDCQVEPVIRFPSPPQLLSETSSVRNSPIRDYSLTAIRSPKRDAEFRKRYPSLTDPTVPYIISPHLTKKDHPPYEYQDDFMDERIKLPPLKFHCERKPLTSIYALLQPCGDHFGKE